MPASDAARRASGHRARRWLYIAHRWIGIVTCLFFAVWFVSGLVMVYVPFPALGDAERLSGLAPIDWTQVRVQPSQALRDAGVAGRARRLALEMRDRAPVWRIAPWAGEPVVVSAATGQIVGRAGMDEARRIAGDFGHARVRAVTGIVRDQWSVAGSFDGDRPLWKAELAGPQRRSLYVSSTSGTVVLDTNERERFWNWLGSVPHWIYPTILRQDNAAWRQVVMWVSGPCIVGAVAGMWIGILRVRMGRRRYRGGGMTPYRGWMKWHHLTGLFGGLFLTTWIFSGWLSVDPLRLFASPGIGQAARIRYAGAGVAPPIALDRLAIVAAGGKRIDLRWIAGRALIVVARGSGSEQVIDARTLLPARIDPRIIVRAASRFVPGAHIVRIDRLIAPDAYWYEVGTLPTLPVFRMRYDDPARTWVHIDPRTGAIVGDTDTRRRLYRWAFDLLHKWDLNGLTLHRPIWDILLWVLSLAGLATAVTGIRIGWARLCRRPAALGR